MENQVSDAQIDLRSTINKNKIPANENAEKVIDIAKKVPHFNKKQKVKDTKY